MKQNNPVQKELTIDLDLRKRLDQTADRIAQLLKQKNIKAYEIMGSIGCGKTSLITRIVQQLKDQYRIFSIAGDLTTDIDAQRIQNEGAEVIQINTGKECHLDPGTILEAIEKINLDNIDLLLIENVGNLVCPADFNLGVDKRIVVVSLTEGPYLVVKHPYTFLSTDIVVINKIDLSPHVSVDPDQLENDVKRVNPKARIFRSSCLNNEGIDEITREMLKSD